MTGDMRARKHCLTPLVAVAGDFWPEPSARFVWTHSNTCGTAAQRGKLLTVLTWQNVRRLPGWGAYGAKQVSQADR